ncbi:MAG TPA: hypothetical protein DCS97_14045 [Planctomycetes bacterium]|nr:hypothetical protein [Planctomycetota bacterium]
MSRSQQELDALDQLAAQVRGGDHEAFRALVMAVQDELRGYCTLIAPTADLAEEVVQSTLVAAWQSIDRYQQRSYLPTWLKSIARNLLLKELRQRATQARHLRDGLSEQIFAAAADGTDPVDEPAEELGALRRCIERLAPKARAIIERHHVAGEAIEDLASQLQVTANAISLQLFRIRKALRTCVEAGAKS